MGKRKRFSHSAFDTLLRCGEAYRLERVEKVPVRPNMSAVGGSAFHTWSEDYDWWRLGQADEPNSPEYYLDYAAAREEERHKLDREHFRVFGRKTKANPAGSNYEYWRDTLLPDLAERYVKWRAASTWQIATDLPPDENDNTTGIEYAVRYTVGRTEILAYVDRLERLPDGRLGAVDLKTWSSKKTTAQLPGYLVGLRQNGVDAVWGAYYHARKGEADVPNFFVGWNEERLAALYHQAATMEMLGIYIPNPSNDCKAFCSVAPHCQFAL